VSVRRAIVVAALTCLFAAGVWLHVDGLNGPDYWEWGWLRLANTGAIVLGFAIAALPALAALFVRNKKVAVALAAISAMSLQFAAASLFGGMPMRMRVTSLVYDAANTSYYTAALQVLELQQRHPEIALVKNYDRSIGFFPMHARTKPLLPVALFVGLLRLFRAEAPLAIAALLALLTGASIVALFAALRRIVDENTALIACVVFALMPSLAIFFPQIDVTYALFTCGVLATWPRALQGSKIAAAIFGLVFFAMSLTSYALLVIGIFCVLLALSNVRQALIAGSIALGVFAAAYLVFDLATGYPVLATFQAALRQQREILPFLHRPYPRSIPFDLLDFALGMGWAPLLAALLYVARRERTTVTPIVLAGLLTPPIVALTGLLQAETSRVWIFLMPFVALAAALELVRWRPAGRLLVAASMVVVTIALFANMRFLWPLRPRPFPPIPAAAFR
jgi:hypothetical protein